MGAPKSGFAAKAADATIAQATEAAVAAGKAWAGDAGGRAP